MDLTTDLGVFSPLASGHTTQNLFGSGPGYDEASGPDAPDGDRFFPVDWFAQEDGVLARGFDGCSGEDSEDRERRLRWADIDEPLAKDETKADVLAAIEQQSKDYLLPDDEPLLTVDPNYRPYLPPAPKAVRKFSDGDLKPVTPGVLKMRVRVLVLTKGKKGKKEGRIVPKKCAIPVVVRTKKRY